jgi:hypothetical protein
MHKRILSGVAFLILAGLAWPSNEPWKAKPYQQWDKADLALILNGSPWAKKVVVDVNWKRDALSGSQNQMPATDQTGALRQHMDISKGGMPDSAPPDRSMDTASSSGGTSTPAKAAFIIRWYSSRVIREALAREAVVSGRISEAEGDKLLDEPVAGYEIIVFGPDMTPFQNLTEDQLKSASYLEGKQSKQKVAPSSVRANKGPDGRTNSLAFLFPKKIDGGADVASAQEKAVEFVCKVKGLDLHNVFDITKMVDEKGQDF